MKLLKVMTPLSLVTAAGLPVLSRGLIAMNTAASSSEGLAPTPPMG